MSLLDLIFGQKIIPITIGVAVLLIVAALTLTLIPRIRKSRAEAKLRRAEQRAEKERIAAELAEQEAAEEAERAAASPNKRRKKKGAKGAPAPKTAQDVPASAAAQPAATVAAPVPAPAAAAKPAAAAAAPVAAAPAAQTQTPQAEQPGPNAMQDILTSLFTDDDASERQAVLLRGTADVDMANLVTLGQQIIVQMRGGKTITVVESKELE